MLCRVSMYDFILINAASDIVGCNVRGMAAYLNKHGINTKLLFLAKEYWETFEDGELSSIVDFARGARLIGISLFSNYLSISRCLTEHLVEQFCSQQSARCAFKKVLHLEIPLSRDPLFFVQKQITQKMNTVYRRYEDKADCSDR